MKQLILKCLRKLYLILPMPLEWKRRVRDLTADKYSFGERLVRAAQAQGEREIHAAENAPANIGTTHAGDPLAPAPAGWNFHRGISAINSVSRSINFEHEEASALSSFSTKLMAFYLPQFHPIPENDAWWGKGFTEWTNVARAVPQFEGHYQPHLPGELGFYDLRTDGVMRRQAELAKAHGIHGFCFYFYWFGGKRLLEAPVESFLQDESIDLSFSLCWANENWTRRWDGHDHDVLIGQKHSEEDDYAFIEYVARYMRDPRYLRIDGRPVLTVYRPSLLPDVRATALRWRKRCRELGVGEIYLAFTLAFDSFAPASIEFDGAIEFPPNNTFPPNITAEIVKFNPDFSGAAYDWRCYIDRSKKYTRPGYDIFRGTCPSWDNEARKSGRGTVLRYSSPRGYGDWLFNAITETTSRATNPDKRIVFINAWNEWAEGAHLEPDARFGYAYLNATHRAHELAAREGAYHLPTRVTVVVHAYYPELLPEIVDCLNDWTIPFRVIVTTTVGKEQAVASALKQLKQPFEVFAYENRGRDVLPFLRVSSILLNQGEEIVLKLHTKKSLHRGDGELWRRDLLEKLARAGRSMEIFDAFKRSSDLALVAPEGHILSMDTYWGSNADSVRYLCRRMGVSGPDVGSSFFPAGSMFFVRLDALRPLLDAHLGEHEFEDESGQVDGTLPHAIERIFGVLANHAGRFMAAGDAPDVAYTSGAQAYPFAEGAEE